MSQWVTEQNAEGKKISDSKNVEKKKRRNRKGRIQKNRIQKCQNRAVLRNEKHTR